MKIVGADVNGKVTYVTGHREPLKGVTNGLGTYSHQGRINGDATPEELRYTIISIGSTHCIHG